MHDEFFDALGIHIPYYLLKKHDGMAGRREASFERQRRRT
jgi:hypothetical protein